MAKDDYIAKVRCEKARKARYRKAFALARKREAVRGKSLKWSEWVLEALDTHADVDLTPAAARL